NTNFPQTDEHPVVCVSWNDAKAYCDWMSKKTGRTARLPTEAEWEYACRAGTRTTWFFGDQEAAFPDYAWCAKNSGWQTQPVGLKRPNLWGFHEMLGNVTNWCQDWGAPYTGDAVDPTGPESALYRCLRGGAWGSSAIGARVAARSMDEVKGGAT